MRDAPVLEGNRRGGGGGVSRKEPERQPMTGGSGRLRRRSSRNFVYFSFSFWSLDDAGLKGGRESFFSTCRRTTYGIYLQHCSVYRASGGARTAGSRAKPGRKTSHTVLSTSLNGHAVCPRCTVHSLLYCTSHILCRMLSQSTYRGMGRRPAGDAAGLHTQYSTVQ